MRDLIERLRSVQWEVIDDDDWGSRCVFVDMRPDDFRALLEEAAAALEAAREDATPPATSPVRILIEAIESEIRQLEGKADWKSQTARIASLRAALDAALAAQAPRACTCHPDDRPDGHCRERYAASECQALAAQAQDANADALDAARYRWLRDREIPEWLELWHQNPDRIDAAIDQARGKAGQEVGK